MKQTFTTYGECKSVHHRGKIMRLLCTYGVIVVLLLLRFTTFAQSAGAVQGTVRDEKGQPIPGVTVKLKGTTNGTVTDINGKFNIAAPQGSTLILTFVGYQERDIQVTDQKSYSVDLAPASSALNEVVVVGYGTQKKVSLTSAVTSVSAPEIVTTKNENLQNMLTGKIAGLQINQNTSEPGDFANNISIRGMGNPLIVVDGVQQPDFAVTGGNGDNSVGSSNIFSRLDPNDIESISVLKDAAAAVYGVKAANGVILITTKRGKAGAFQMNYSGTYGYQVPSGLPKTVNATDYMTLVNQQALHQANGGKLVYTPADFEAYANGSKTSTDWYDATFRKSAMQQQHNLSATGGNDAAQYLVSGGYLDQDGILQSNDLNYKRYNVRSNVTGKIGKNLTVNLNMSAIYDKKNSPAQSFWYTTREAWRELPTQTIYANNTAPYYLKGQVDGGNPIAYGDADINGYNTQANKFFDGLLSLEYRVPFVPGLSLKGLYSYDEQIQDNKTFQRSYNLYEYNDATKAYTPTLNNSPAFVQRQYYDYPKNTDQFSINYTHSFGSHNISGLLLYEGNQQTGDNFAAYRQLAIPVDQIIAGNAANQNATQDAGNRALYSYATNSIVGRATYDFKGKYLAEFSFRDDKSSRFAPSQGWGFFPSGSLGWRVSDESFWKNSHALSFIDNLKLRASYGVLGDDGSVYYQFLNGYNYPAGGSNNQLPSGAVFGGQFVNAVQSTGIPNVNITWSTSHTFDAGVDIDAFKGALNITADYFIRDRKGLLAAPTLQVPDVLGAPLPQANLNGDRTQGIDFEVGHHGSIGKFKYNVKGTFLYTNTRNTTYAETGRGNSYLDWLNGQTGRNQNVQIGYSGAGQYQNYQQILNSPTYVNRATVVGDYIYEDWNGDGQIDGNDNHPVAYGAGANSGPGVLPKITYGLTLGGSYENFDINLLLQGTGIYSVSYVEQLNIPLWGGGSALTQFLNDWHPVDPAADPYNPNTVWAPGHFAYTGSVPNTNSSFNYQDASYIRLKSAQVGYTLPGHVMKSIGVRGVRVYFSGYNLFTITKVKYVDPEHPTGTYGYLYPLDKIYNIGLDVKF